MLYLSANLLLFYQAPSFVFVLFSGIQCLVVKRKEHPFYSLNNKKIFCRKWLTIKEGYLEKNSPIVFQQSGHTDTSGG